MTKDYWSTANEELRQRFSEKVNGKASTGNRPQAGKYAMPGPDETMLPGPDVTITDHNGRVRVVKTTMYAKTLKAKKGNDHE